jgi:hypothetical protein
VVAISIGGEVALESVISQGCTPIGQTWTITRAEQNLIYEIGNRPAYTVLAETFSNLPEEEQKKTRSNLFVGLVINEYLEEWSPNEHPDVKAMVHEFGPSITGMMLATRVGAGIAAELGSMVVTQQIDALRVMGSDPVRRLVAPRIAAALVMIPILTIISNALGIFGAGLISIFSLKLTWAYYWRTVGNALSVNDIVMGLSKPVVFGFILASVGCYMGLSTRGGTHGVGVATTRSVVVASVLILVSDFFMTKVLLLVFPVS